MKSIVFYASLKRPTAKQYNSGDSVVHTLAVPVAGKTRLIYIRTQEKNLSAENALDHARPRAGELVLNTMEIPGV